MSKRLGRNQKNAWRQRVAELELENQHLRVALKKMRGFHDDAVAETKRIAEEVRAVSAESAILPAWWDRTAEPPIRRRYIASRPMSMRVFPTRMVATESIHGGLEFHEESAVGVATADPLTGRRSPMYAVTHGPQTP